MGRLSPYQTLQQHKNNCVSLLLSRVYKRSVNYAPLTIRFTSLLKCCFRSLTW